MTFPENHKKVPRLLKQQGDSCYAYAVCMAIECKLNGEIKLDPLKFYKDTTADGRQPHMIKALEYARDFGVPIEKSNERYKIRGFSPVQRPTSFIFKNIHHSIQKGEPVLISLDWGNTDTLTKLTKDGIVQPRPRAMHAVVGVDTVGLSAILFANPHGDHYGENGYAVIDLNHGLREKTIAGGYILQI